MYVMRMTLEESEMEHNVYGPLIFAWPGLFLIDIDPGGSPFCHCRRSAGHELSSSVPESKWAELPTITSHFVHRLKDVSQFIGSHFYG